MFVCLSCVALVQLNGINVNLPIAPASGVSVFQSGMNYVVFMDFGLTVRYDGDDNMAIKVINE